MQVRNELTPVGPAVQNKEGVVEGLIEITMLQDQGLEREVVAAAGENMQRQPEVM